MHVRPVSGVLPTPPAGHSLDRMQVTHLTAPQCGAWHDFLSREPTIALLQSWEWGDFKESFGWEVFRVARTRLHRGLDASGKHEKGVAAL